MISAKTVTRILVWSFIGLCLLINCFFYFFGNINKLKNAVELNLKNQLQCTVKLGDLEWDWDGLRLGVTTSQITLYDKENNIVLQGGPTRFVWHLKNIIIGSYSHFHSIDSTNLYLNAIRNKEGAWNFIEIFPPGPPPKVDNLRLHNSIVYLIDQLNPATQKILYKDLNLIFEKNLFSKIRKIDLTTRIGSLKTYSFIKIKGRYSEMKKFDWSKSELNIFLVAKNVELSNWYGYLSNLVKEPEIKRISGEFTGVLRIKKIKKEKQIKLRIKTNTNQFIIGFQNKDIAQVIEIPKTDVFAKVFIEQNKIFLQNLKSNIDELSYTLNGYIYNWSKTLPEVNLELKTNRFNFKTVKPYLPLSLLPARTRARIEPVNDDGYVELNLKLNGPLIAPKYNGTVLLSNFNLTAESGFLNVISGLEGKLILNDQIMKIDHLNIPIEGSPLTVTGLIDSENAKSNFTVAGKDLNIHHLFSLFAEAGLQSSILKEVSSEGKIDLNLEVANAPDTPPDIMGKLGFHDVRLLIFKEEPLEIKNVVGDLLLDGSKVTFNNLNGLINNEGFHINGNFSLKEDEKVNLLVEAKHLKIIPYVLSFITSKTPFKPVAETISGEVSDLNLNISGSFSKPILFGMLLINNVSFGLPKLEDGISNITGSLSFEGTELVIDDLSGKIQNTDFAIAGYIRDLFSAPKPKIRLITGDLEITNLWNFIKEQLKTTLLNTQAEALEKFNGIAAIDIFLHPDAVLGNIFFKDVEIKYKSLPFGLTNLTGRLVISEKDLNLYGLKGSIDEGNNFNCNLTVSDYLDPNFNLQGQLWTDLSIPSLIKAINAPELNQITSDGLIPTIATFDITFPWVNLSLYSILDDMLMLEFPPYIRKPPDKSYTISTNLDFNSDSMDLYLNEFNIKANKLSITANGNIKNISSQKPELMLHFRTDEPCGLFMIIEPIIPLMGLKAWGMIELEGSVSGTPSMYTISSNAVASEVELPELFGKKLTATDGFFNIYLDTEQGVANSKINNIQYASLNANSVSLSLNYSNPIIYCNEFSLDAHPGNIFAVGSYDPRDNAVNCTINGSELDLSSLGSFVLLDPTKLSGITNFSLMIDGKGKTKNEILENSIGNLSFSVTDGKLGQVALLQKGLQFASIFTQGIFGFNLKNVLSLFFKYQDGSFNKIRGELDLKDGIVKAKEFIYRAKDLYLNSFGFVDLINSFVGLSFYGYIPEKKVEEIKSKTNTFTGAISIVPDTIGKKRFFIPFLSSNPPRYFKFEIKGDIKNPKKITSHTRHSFKWLKGKQLFKEVKYVPKAEQ